MARRAPSRSTPRPPDECPPVTPVRFVVRPWPDGAGRIRYCKAPYVCKPWRPGEPIPNDWVDVAPPSLAAPSTKCDIRLAASTRQAAGVQLDRGEAAAASRLPRVPRQARTPRSPRFPRPPRKRRPPRRPRAARKARLPRAPQRRPSRAGLKFYCYYEYDSPKFERLHAVSHTGPWTREQHEATLARHPQVKALEVAKGLSCPDLSQSECARQAAAFVRPLQQLLGWKRPDYPTPEEVAARRAGRVARPTAPPVAAPPQVPGEPPPPPPYQLPPAAALYCLKNSAFNYVDCFLTANNSLVWSNWQHGPWAGTPAPPGAPFGAGIGA